LLVKYNNKIKITNYTNIFIIYFNKFKKIYI